MTWQKTGVEFWDDCAQADLSDAAVRTHSEAIGWLYRVESDDMRIRKELVPRFVGSKNWQTAIAELVSKEFWQEDTTSYIVVHHADVIRASIAAQRKKRERDKRAQQAWRDRNVDPD